MKKSKKYLIGLFEQIKKENNLTYYDTHIHPTDVFGLCDYCVPHTHSAGPSLLERFQYTDSILRILSIFFKYFPSYIYKEIQNNFKYNTEKFLLENMHKACIDMGVMVPIYPHATPEKIYQTFKSMHLLHLGSVDIHNLTPKEIQKSIDTQVEKMHIIGIKLHPNIQKFYPEPSLNTENIRQKLETIYDAANTRQLYILMHGGLSYVPISSYEKKFEKREFGLINNFFSRDNTTFIDKINVPIIVAHIGLYNVINADISELHKLYDKNMVYVDTAGVNPRLVRKYIERYGTKKIVFGSDAPYFDLEYNVYLILNMLYSMGADNFTEKVSDIFSRNYERILRDINIL